MNLFPELKKRYSGDNLNAREAQRLAEFIAFGPVVFQTARILLKWGILDIIRDSDNGMTIDEDGREQSEEDIRRAKQAETKDTYV